jgi:6-phosphogluconolactonase
VERGLTLHVEVFPDPSGVVRALANRIVKAAEEAVARSGRFALAISGGATPEPLFDLLGDSYYPKLPWTKTDLFWVDERAVAPDDPRSNFGAARRRMAPVFQADAARIHRIRGEADLPEHAADEYERELHRFFGKAPPGESKTFDLLLLGIGPDGHTASLFPGSPALEERTRWVRAVPAASRDPRVARITLTLPAIDAAREVAFLVTGADKSRVVRRILFEHGPDPAPWPAARVRPQGPLRWYLDRAAAGEPPR